VRVPLHSTCDASRLAALLLPQILPVFSVVAPSQSGASPVSVRRGTLTTGSAARVMRGATLVEVLMAAALTLVLSAIAARGLVEATRAFAWQPAAGELAARADAVARQLHADLHAAGAGPRVPIDPVGDPAGLSPSHRLAPWVPAVLPRVVAIDGGDPDTTAAVDRVSMLAVADGAPQAAVHSRPPRWALVPGPSCLAPGDGCGFRAGLPVLLLGRAPGAQIGEVEGVDASGVWLRGVADVDPAGALAGVEIVSYRFDAARGELLKARAGGRGLVVADRVSAFVVEWWADGAGGPLRLDASSLGDGPWEGRTPLRYDADLRRVRRLRIRMRLAAEQADIADVDVRVDVAPPALRGGV
jgi:hypothetical protein